MIILTVDKERFLDRLAAVHSWPGPACLCLLPGHGLAAAEITHAQRQFFIFDFMPAPVSRLGMLRTVILQLMRQRSLPLKGPLLFAADGSEPIAFGELARKVDANPFVIEYRLNPETGVLDQLLLGGGIMGNPLFPTFFRNMQEDLEEAHAAKSLSVLKEHLVFE